MATGKPEIAMNMEVKRQLLPPSARFQHLSAGKTVIQRMPARNVFLNHWSVAKLLWGCQMLMQDTLLTGPCYRVQLRNSELAASSRRYQKSSSESSWI